MDPVPPPPQGPQPYWSFSTCCGCLAVIVFVFIALSIGALWSTYTYYLPKEPLPIERQKPAPELEDAVAEKRAALAAGETVELTPEELTVLVQKGLETRDAGAIFRASAGPEGVVLFQFTKRFSDQEPFYLRGRHLNIEMAGKGKIEKGKVSELEVKRYRLGGSEVTDPEFKTILEQFDKPWLGTDRIGEELKRIDLLEFGDGIIELRLAHP